MDNRHLDDRDRELIESAQSCLRKNFTPPKHTVGAAVRGSSGRIYTGVNLLACGYGPCAETIAVGAAFTAGEEQIVSCVAVCRRGEAYPVLSPCGNCRQLLADYAPEAEVIYEEDGQVKKARTLDLLPGAYRSAFE